MKLLGSEHFYYSASHTISKLTLMLLLVMGCAKAVSAAELWVTALSPDRDSSDGKCSLIEAIQNANKDTQVNRDCPSGNGADTIHLQKYKTYVLYKAIYDSGTDGSNGLPVIRSRIIIDGRGSVIIRAQAENAASAYRILEVAPGGDLEISDTELRNGGANWTSAEGISVGEHERTYSGGALYNAGKVTMRRVIANSNFPVQTIHNSATGRMLITQSTIEGGNNAVDNDGQLILRNSAIVSAPGISVLNGSASAKATLRNCTLAGGSEIAVMNLGTLVVEHCTISGNDLAIDNKGPEFVLANSLIAANYGEPPAYSPEVRDTAGTITSHHNVFGDISKSFLPDNNFSSYFAENLQPDQTDILATADGGSPTDLYNIIAPGDALDYLLEDNGGATQTIALVPRSPAVDSADSTSCPPRDQRGVQRPQLLACDIGAYELEPLSLRVSDYFIVESYGPAYVTVKLNYASNKKVTVGYATKPRKALPGVDYRGVSGRLTFSPGEVAKRIPVKLVDDDKRERIETFVVRLYQPTNATLARDLATVTVLDDD